MLVLKFSPEEPSAEASSVKPPNKIENFFKFFSELREQVLLISFFVSFPRETLNSRSHGNANLILCLRFFFFDFRIFVVLKNNIQQ